MLDNGLVEGIVLRAMTFFRVKTYDLQSGDDNAMVASHLEWLCCMVVLLSRMVHAWM
jgi:hypothetical protein